MADYKRRRCPLWIVSRGITTAIYFESDDNYSDALLCLILPKQRTQTLIVQKASADANHFDLYLNGESETVFLDI